ncbi:aminoacyl-tRNA hydrolase [Candidatus Saccharibacteria bacterium]|nr:aminoacyl-tRNA hydrolase [Candidatus Saccharibacteria bacterium]
MGLFHRKEIQQNEISYTISSSQGRTVLVVGLGNPGKDYVLTRHNIGYECADSLVAANDGTWSDKRSLKSMVADLRLGQARVVVIKPITFMNLSGEAVQAVQRFYKISSTDTIVIHDELDIPFGQIRTRLGGSSAGHNGIKSLIAHIGNDFSRIKVGIKNDLNLKVDSADFVLQKFSKEEQGHMKMLTTEVNALLNEAIFSGSLPSDTRQFI